jgi:hypothetical protein
MKRPLAWLLAAAFAGLSLAAQARGLAFSETMSGVAYQDGEYRNASVSLRVTVADIDAWSQNLDVPATVTGTLTMDRLPVQPVTGTLVILGPGPGGDGRLLTYRFAGTSLQFTGIKHVEDAAGTEVFDDMTTLHGVFQPRGAPPPTVYDLLYGAAWTTELHFAWWDPAVVWNFAASFTTIATPWYQVLEVEALFVRTMFGALAQTLFPWLV